MIKENERLIFLSLSSIYPLLFFLLFYLGTVRGESVPFSIQAFAQPYSGGFAFMSLVFAALSFLDLGLYHAILLPKYLNNPKTHLLAIVFPEVIAIFGFIIGFFNNNPWAAIPFFALGFANYAYAYLKISQQS